MSGQKSTAVEDPALQAVSAELRRLSVAQEQHERQGVGGPRAPPVQGTPAIPSAAAAPAGPPRTSRGSGGGGGVAAAVAAAAMGGEEEGDEDEEEEEEEEEEDEEEEERRPRHGCMAGRLTTDAEAPRALAAGGWPGMPYRLMRRLELAQEGWDYSGDDEGGSDTESLGSSTDEDGWPSAVHTGLTVDPELLAEHARRSMEQYSARRQLVREYEARQASRRRPAPARGGRGRGRGRGRGGGRRGRGRGRGRRRGYP